MTYTHEQFAHLLDRTVEKLKVLAATKGAEYARGGDRLDNFRRASVTLNIQMEEVWWIYAGKHWDAITTYVKDTIEMTQRERSEPIEGRAHDMIVYLLLFLAMVEERNGDIPF